VVHAYKVLLPWIILGIAMLFTGILLEIVPEKGKKLSMKINKSIYPLKYASIHIMER
jgi:hypothetical protein